MFQGWDNFYFMIGGAGASLIGLLFVVVTLTSGQDRSRAMRGQALYMTPTMLHFAVVFTMSAVAVAPRLPVPVMAVLFGLLALAGLGNAARSCVGIGGLRRGEDPPHWSDMWMYGATPGLVYLGLLAAAAAFWARAPWSAHVIAALLLSLLLVGIRNAWDLITWMAPMRRPAS